VLAVDNRLPTIRPLPDVKCGLALPQCAGYPLADRCVRLAARPAAALRPEGDLAAAAGEL